MSGRAGPRRNGAVSGWIPERLCALSGVSNGVTLRSCIVLGCELQRMGTVLGLAVVKGIPVGPARQTSCRAVQNPRSALAMCWATPW